MTIRTRFQRTAIAVILVFPLLLTPALPAAADEVGSGWAQEIAEWMSTWVTSWQSPTRTTEGHRAPDSLGSTHQALKQQPRAIPEGRDDGADRGVLKPMITLNAHEEQNCDAIPEIDPLGQC